MYRPDWDFSDIELDDDETPNPQYIPPEKTEPILLKCPRCRDYLVYCICPDWEAATDPAIFADYHTEAGQRV